MIEELVNRLINMTNILMILGSLLWVLFIAAVTIGLILYYRSKKMIIIVTGKDWAGCYLQDDITRKNKIIKSLEKEVARRGNILNKDDHFIIDVPDHSIAIETFRIVEVGHNYVKLEYTGGAS